MNLIINSLILLFILAIASQLISDYDAIRTYAVYDLYYPYINPKAGALAYEKAYKHASENADKLREQSNTLVNQMKKKWMEPVRSSMNEITEPFYEELEGIFIERERSLLSLTAIDSEAAELTLPEEYKKFYEKRKKADINEYEAFTAYRKAMDALKTGQVVYTFGEQYSAVMAYLSDTEHLTAESVDQIVLNKTSFDAFYNADIAPLIKQKFFTDEMEKSLVDGTELLRLFSDYQKLRLSGNEAEARRHFEKILSMYRNEDSKTMVELFLDWSNERVQPLFREQDKKHKNSYLLFKESYSYAESENLKEVVEIWNGVYPGTTDTVLEQAI